MPLLVYKRIRSVPNSRFRSLDNIATVLQQGEKRPMLCHECEERFSFLETKFARNFLDCFLQTKSVPKIQNDWLDNYILSVAWRVLYDDLYRLNSHTQHFSREIFEDFCEQLRIYLLSVKKEDFCPIPEKFKNRIYSIESFAPSIRDNPFVECGIFGYSVYFNKSNTFAVIVCYAGLAFVTEFVPDSNRLLIMHMGRSAPPLCRRLAQKAELKNELVTQYTEMLTRYKEVMTPELREKISAFYKKK